MQGVNYHLTSTAGFIRGDQEDDDEINMVRISTIYDKWYDIFTYIYKDESA